jgi:hypothetical protein
MFGSSLPSALGWLVTTKVYPGTGADIVMESIAPTTVDWCYGDITSTIANVSTLPVSGRGEVLKQLNLQQKHEISGLYIWGSDTHISHPLDVSYGRICCIYICRPHGQPSVGTHGRICNKGNALCLSSPCPPLRSVWRADRTHSQGSRSGAGTVHTCLPGAPSRLNSVEVCIE